jgi:hypothetical protein
MIGEEEAPGMDDFSPTLRECVLMLSNSYGINRGLSTKSWPFIMANFTQNPNTPTTTKFNNQLNLGSTTIEKN